MQRIVTHLWFDNQAEEAVNHYVSTFKNSRVTKVARYGEAGPGPVGSVMTIEFELEGQTFMALNGGPVFTFSPAISLLVHCATQEEVDDLWERLSEGGEKGQCGWLTDKYGLSWQVVPTVLDELLSDPDQVRAQRVMQVMLQMTKLDISQLKAAYEGR
ncbi:MAG: VOC family protein [Chloroflexota bacterium]